ncbi:MAG: hypothetical protein NTY64_01455, partial [Deltaproteobacteria bacterium]|nr:hypothetical protein [Deltaproteobacteria bacterium]
GCGRNYDLLKIDGFVKSPSAALHCLLRRCGVLPSTPHSSGIVRLASGAFYLAIQILTFYEFIKIVGKNFTCEISHPDEPLQRLRAEAKRLNMEDRVIVLQHGESFTIH